MGYTRGNSLEHREEGTLEDVASTVCNLGVRKVCFYIPKTHQFQVYRSAPRSLGIMDPPPPPRHHPGRCAPVRRSLSSPPRRAQVPGCQLIMKVQRSFAIRTLSFRHPGARAHEGPDLSLLGKCRHITNGVPRRLVPPRPQHLVSFHPFKVPLQYRNCTKYLLSRIIR